MESNKVKVKRLKVKVLARCLILCLLFPVSPSHAQTWKEFFKQRKTQIKYLGQQIAALQAYAGYLKQGYEIAGSGLRTIKGITSGEFNLHSGFIHSLQRLNPALTNNVRLAEIIAFQLEISQAFSGIKDRPYLSAGNRDYISQVKAQVLEECGKDLEELLLLVSPGKVEMNDKERLEHLDQVHESMKDKLAFTQSFMNQVRLLIRQRAKEQQSIHSIRNLYESN